MRKHPACACYSKTTYAEASTSEALASARQSKLSFFQYAILLCACVHNLRALARRLEIGGRLGLDVRILQNKLALRVRLVNGKRRLLVHRVPACKEPALLKARYVAALNDDPMIGRAGCNKAAGPGTLLALLPTRISPWRLQTVAISKSTPESALL